MADTQYIVIAIGSAKEELCVPTFSMPERVYDAPSLKNSLVVPLFILPQLNRNMNKTSKEKKNTCDPWHFAKLVQSHYITYHVYVTSIQNVISNELFKPKH